jgi:hypothetical protein
VLEVVVEETAARLKKVGNEGVRVVLTAGDTRGDISGNLATKHLE